MKTDKNDSLLTNLIILSSLNKFSKDYLHDILLNDELVEMLSEIKKKDFDFFCYVLGIDNNSNNEKKNIN